MASLFWQTTGTGSRNLVLIHGWGLNANIWSCIIPQLASHFCIYLVDLPGYGYNRSCRAFTLEQIVKKFLESDFPQGALWLGWSLGGLVATMMAYQHPQEIIGLITVASSPYFCADDYWPGIEPKVLDNFIQDLRLDFTRTINRFLKLQTLNTESARQDTRWLKSIMLAQPIPEIKVLSSGLTILRNSDLRSALGWLNVPLLRIYGHLDNLVPCKVVSLVDTYSPNSQSIVFTGAAHVPFISHSTLFCQVLYDFSQTVT